MLIKAAAGLLERGLLLVLGAGLPKLTPTGSGIFRNTRRSSI
jgi:hypothetical protein